MKPDSKPPPVASLPCDEPGAEAFRASVIARMAEGLCVCHAVPEHPFMAFTVWNDRMIQLTGYTLEEINRLGWYHTMFPDPARRQYAFERIARMRQGEDLRDEEWTVRHKDGRQRVLRISTSILKSSDHQTHVLALMQDVTARREAEEELRRQRAEVHAVNRLLLDSLLRHTAEQMAHGCLVVAEELTGSAFGFVAELNPEDRWTVVGSSVPGWDASPSPEAPADARIRELPPGGLWMRVFHSGQSLIVNDPVALPGGVGLPPGHPPLTAFLGVPLKSGKLTTGLIGLANKPGGYDQADQRAVENLVVAFVELQRRKWIETALRQSEARNRALVKALPDLIFLVNRQGVLVDYHAGDPKLLYAPPERFVDRPMREVLPAAVAEGLEQGARRALETRTTQTFEYPLPIRGEDHHFEARLAACGRDLVIFIVRDITGRKRAEAERRELLRRVVNAQEQERQRLATELHDQLGQELTALQLRIKSIESLSPPGSRCLQELPGLRQITERLTRRVHDLAWELRPALLDDLGLPAALRRHVEDWSKENAVAVDFHAQGFETELVPPLIATALFRVAQEALRNVARHARAHAVSVLLQQRRDGVVLVVEDDGAGFDVAAVLGARESRDRLGLMGMQERVQALDGTLEIESKPGQGTTVIARAPLAGGRAP